MKKFLTLVLLVLITTLSFSTNSKETLSFVTKETVTNDQVRIATLQVEFELSGGKYGQDFGKKATIKCHDNYTLPLGSACVDVDGIIVQVNWVCILWHTDGNGNPIYCDRYQYSGVINENCSC